MTAYEGRLVLVGLPHRAGFEDIGAYVEDFKLNPDMGILTLFAEGSNYRTHRRRILLSPGAKALLQSLTWGAKHPGQAAHTWAPAWWERHSNCIEGVMKDDTGVTVTDIYLGVELREGKMPKIYVAKPNGNYIALVTGGSGYRGGLWRGYYGQVKELVMVEAGGSLGDIFIGLYHVEPPAIIHVNRNGRLYGAPPNAIAVFTKDKVYTDTVEDEEIPDLLELLGVETHGVEEKGD